MTNEELERELDALVADGTLECKIVNGEKQYKITEKGKRDVEERIAKTEEGAALLRELAAKKPN